MERFEGQFFEQLLAQSIAADLSSLSREKPLLSDSLLRQDLAAFFQLDEHFRLGMMAADGISEVLQLCADTVVGFPGIVWGAGYLVDERSGGLDMIVSANVPDVILSQIEHYQPDAHMSQHVKAGHPLYLVRTGQESVSDVPAMSVLPILHHGEAVACLTVASGSKNMLPPRTRHLLEGISDYAGTVIARLIAEEKVKRIQDSQEEMLTSLVHSLKTPLAIMHGYIDLLISHNKGTEHFLDQDRVLRKVMTQSERVSALITDLLELEEIAADRLFENSNTFSVGAIVERIIERLDDEADPRIVLELPEEDLLIEAEQSWLTHAIEHVIVNALRFSSAPILVQVRGTDKNTIIDVIDHGHGISSEDLPHIFERFYHASYLHNGRPNPGAGLGLTLAGSIIKRFHGSIRVESTVDQGSCFSILLPRSFKA